MRGAKTNVCFGPCVDGSELARALFTLAALVGAAMCSAFKCGTRAAGHNALRGSGPGQKLAFASHHAGWRNLFQAASATGSL